MQTTEEVETKPVVGMGATITCGSDRYPGTVMRVSASGKTVWVIEDDFRRKDHNGPFTESQEYEFFPNPNGHIYRVHFTKRGFWKAGWQTVWFGGRGAYRDPCF